MANRNNIKPFAVHKVHELPTQIKPTDKGIINLMGLDPENSNGSHWICYYNAPDRKDVILFDSFGQAPDPRVLKFLKSGGKRVLSSTSELQWIKSQNCGSYSIRVLAELDQGEELYEILADFDVGNQKGNEKELFEE
jgi:hypothetical protein